MWAQVMEHHEYTEGGRLTDPAHCDHGSLVTVDVMLADADDFDGGDSHGRRCHLDPPYHIPFVMFLTKYSMGSCLDDRLAGG